MSLFSDNQISITRDLHDMEKEFGYPSFTWNGGSYGCIAANSKRANILKQGGFDVDIPLRMTVRRYYYDFGNDELNELFSSDPQLNDSVVFNAVNYFIKTITTDITNTFYRMELTRKKN